MVATSIIQFFPMAYVIECYILLFVMLGSLAEC